MAALWFLPRIAAGEVSRFTYAQLRQFRHLSITFQLLLRGKKSMNKGDGNRLCMSLLLSQLFFLSFIVFFFYVGGGGVKGVMKHSRVLFSSQGVHFVYMGSSSGPLPQSYLFLRKTNNTHTMFKHFSTSTVQSSSVVLRCLSFFINKSINQF